MASERDLGGMESDIKEMKQDMKRVLRSLEGIHFKLAKLQTTQDYMVDALLGIEDIEILRERLQGRGSAEAAV